MSGMTMGIFNFNNFAEFLRMWLASERATNPNFSNLVLTRELGLKSSSLLSMVASGQRSPSRELLLKFKARLNWTDEEFVFAMHLAVSRQVRPRRQSRAIAAEHVRIVVGKPSEQSAELEAPLKSES